MEKKTDKAYKSNILGLNTWHKKRFNTNEYDFVHAGCMIIK